MKLKAKDGKFKETDVLETKGIFRLIDSNIPRNYWSDLKRKLEEEGSQLYENIVQLKMKAKNGKFYKTDTLDTKGIFRLIESVPSSKERTI